jgi:hypothetical protein
MSSTALASISTTDLSFVCGGQQGAKPPGITTGDVAEVATKATKAVLNPAGTVVSNANQAYRQFNDPRIKDAGIGTRLLNGGLGLFGINPLD